jgi:hypothetical protein
MRKLGYINEKFLDGSIYSKLLAESTGMWKRYLIYQAQNICCSWSESKRPKIFEMQLSIHTNDALAVNNDYMIMWMKLLTKQQQLEHV